MQMIEKKETWEREKEAIEQWNVDSRSAGSIDELGRAPEGKEWRGADEPGWYERWSAHNPNPTQAWIKPGVSGGAKSESKLRLEKNAEGNKRDC